MFRTLRDHPEVSGFRDTGVPEDEGQHLQSVYPPAKTYGGPGRFGFADEAHLTEESPLVSDESRTTIFAEWARYWDLSKPVLLEKSPPNLIRGRFLQALFPNSSFVFVIRHPIVVSLATQKWAKNSVPELVAHWAHCHRLFLEDLPHLERSVIIRYEEWITAPAEHARRLYEALDLPAGVVSESSDPIIDANANYFERWAEEQARDSEARDRLVAFEGAANEFGYSVLDSARPTREGVGARVHARALR